MTHSSSFEVPLVSVVIPCYNHGNFLGETIESVLQQSYSNIEIIVVDDGSTDNTKNVASRYPQVKYIFQENQGLSAARNAGVKQCKGDFVVFSDADDLLLSHALEYNITILQADPKLAFVSGAYELINTDKTKITDVVRPVIADHYLTLLKYNYIGMHGTLMYRRWVFDEFLFDVSLRACEDYDMYLRIARKFPVHHHTNILTAYRMHATNMSGDMSLMLSQVLKVLQHQLPGLTAPNERKAYKEGVKEWCNYYGGLLYFNLRTNTIKPTKKVVNTLKKHDSKRYYRYVIITFYEKIFKKAGSRV